MNKRYITDKQIHTSVLDIVSQMYSDEWRPDYIVGVTRGGLYPAVLMSHYTGIKMHTLDVRLRDGDEHESNAWMQDDAQCGTNILVLDDINDTGETFLWIKQDWKLENINDDIVNVRFASLIDNIPSKFDVDYTSIEINKDEDPAWIVFPFEEWW